MNRDNWKWPGSSVGFHWPDEISERDAQHLDFIERAVGRDTIRAVPSLLAFGISPYRTDQHDEIVRLSKLLGGRFERLAACFGYINGRHIFETMLDPEADLLVYPSTAGGLCIFRFITGVPLPKLRISKAGCELRAKGVLDI